MMHLEILLFIISFDNPGISTSALWLAILEMKINIFDFSYDVTLYVYRKIPIPSRHRVMYREMTSFYFFYVLSYSSNTQ